MSLKLGEPFPDFSVKTTFGDMQLHEYFGDSWGILFSHPGDFTPVCTTELARVVQLKDEFASRNCKVIGLSCDSIESHLEWTKDIKVYAEVFGEDFPFPIIADKDWELVVELGMLDPDEKNDTGLPLPARAVFIIDPKKRMRLSILYPATTGRNFDEILRVLDSLQLCDKYQVATPVDWKKGDDVMVQPSLSEEQRKKLFPSITMQSLPSGKNYIRKTAMPDISKSRGDCQK
ncbi:peroxiredoxin-6 [Anthonomus grandis grandis]|uniref:peroxiredoxin-6 n=1 Tax=Anthonomus grandis grandis TaxID=2921223 RepID=UPI0021667797|nr:peroxiredoxin-6 [Anthonomus grandis grandis]